MRTVAIIPARDEVLIIERVVRDLLEARQGTVRLVERVIVCDNGSSDGTAAQAAAAGATVVYESKRGYGAACQRALREIGDAEAVLFVDGDGSVCVNDAWALLEALNQGADLALGARPISLVEFGAMTAPQLAGTRFAVLLIRWLFGHRYADLGPLRAITRNALVKLHMRDQAYGWTVEMQVKALLNQLNIQELPVKTRRRVGKSKISGTWRGVVGAGFGIVGMTLKLRWQAWQDGLRRTSTAAR
jgi:glycosyltransferase involved in cell wall biosynthesis